MTQDLGQADLSMACNISDSGRRQRLVAGVVTVQASAVIFVVLWALRVDPSLRALMAILMWFGMMSIAESIQRSCVWKDLVGTADAELGLPDATLRSQPFRREMRRRTVAMVLITAPIALITGLLSTLI